MGRRTSPYWWGGAIAAVLAGLVLLALVIAPSLTGPDPGGWADGDLSPTTAPLPEPPTVLAAVDGGAPAPTADGIEAAIDSLIQSTGLGDRVSVEVLDVATGGSLYRRRADSPVIPASTIKLVTGVAVLAARGPAYRIPTVAVAGNEPGEVVLVGAGDPTLAVADVGLYPGAARLDLLAAQVGDALGDTPVTKVTVDSTLFPGGVHGPWDASIPGSGYVGPITALMTDGGRVDPEQVRTPAQHWNEPDLAAGRAFAELLGSAPEGVARGTAPAVVEAAGPTPGAELGRVESPPILRLVEIMMVDSDNVVAEALARQVALARGEPASFEGAAVAMAEALADLGVVTGDNVIADGSGLSRDNRLTATLLTQVLSTAASPDQPALSGLFAGLPVAGWSGTLATRYRTPQVDTGSGTGVVRAKTGTLDGVHAIAGTVVTADGRLLAFAFLAEDVPLSQPDAREALDRVAAALATCGCD